MNYVNYSATDQHGLNGRATRSDGLISPTPKHVMLLECRLGLQVQAEFALHSTSSVTCLALPEF